MADLVTRSRLDDSDFNRGLARMRKESRDFNRRLGSEFSKVFSGAAVGGGIAAALYGIGNAVRGAFADADKVSDLAETLREMPSDLVRVGGAATLMGADMEAVVKAAVKMRVNLAKGGKEQAEMLDAMGLKASELSRMRLPEWTMALARGYQRAEQSGRGFLALQTLLGRSGVELANLLQNPEQLIELIESIKPASDAAIMGMGVVADQWNLMLGNMKSRFQDWVWGTYAGWRKFRASLEASEEVGAASRKRFAAEKGAVLGEIPDRAKRVAAERLLYKKIHGEEMAKWMGANAEDAGFMTEGSGYRPGGQIDRAKGGIADAGEGGDGKGDAEKKKVAGLIAEWWKLKKAREEAGRSLEQQLSYLTEAYAAHRNLVGTMDRDSVAYREALVEEQRMLKDIEDVQRKIADEEKRKAEEAGRAKEGEGKDREEKMQEAAKVRELALEAAIAGLKADGKDHAAEEARLRVAAAEKELGMARGSKREAEAYVALMGARNALAEASAGPGGKSKDERIEDLMRGGMRAGAAKRQVRQEDQDARKAEARINTFRRGAEQAPDIMGEGVRDYMEGHKNVSGARAFDSGAWESGSYGQSLADAAAGKGAEGASGGDANGIGQLLQAVNELKAAIVAASGGGE